MSFIIRFIGSIFVLTLGLRYLPLDILLVTPLIQFIATTLLVLISSAIFAVFYPKDKQTPKPPKVEAKYFGNEVQWTEGQTLPVESTDIIPFEVKVSEEVLDDLNRRIDNTRFAEPLIDSAFEYGFNGDYLKTVVHHWRHNFDWRHQENRFNRLPNYKTRIQGLDVHFIHIKPEKSAKKVIPLLVVHGWPGSVVEYLTAIEHLIKEENGVAFEVICPSIPGFGFSSAPKRKGFGVPQTSQIFVELMRRLGHKKFFIHGGDWGSIIAQTTARVYPENVRGIHITMIGGIYSLRGWPLIRYIIGAYIPSLFLTTDEYSLMYPFWEKFTFLLRESGYMHIQSTKPDSVGTALTDSPVGLCAYILEKFSTWTNPDNTTKQNGGLEEKFKLDDLLTNISVYWLTGNITSSLRYYKESFGNTPSGKILVPTAVADFPHELARMPEKCVF
ncbi:epoxide hydrolase 1-like [Oppia nitens]|uniref:epoxide hydrolase 1-like n=1 Tax=Oppia nitens TaxID=1686743 RepID=UPI0023DCC78E|nr:epoxide hydrolase 1-like [Oppia nitens]